MARLPPITRSLQELVEAQAPSELARRRSEIQAEDAEDPDLTRPLVGGFHPWQEVASSRSLYLESGRVVRRGSPGVAIADAGTDRIIVKFDRRLDLSDECLGVQPDDIVTQLSRSFGGLRVLQLVVATQDLYFNDEVAGVGFGTRGVILGVCETDPSRLVVDFESRLDGARGNVAVMPFEIASPGPHAGGFWIAQRVRAARHLVNERQRLVNRGTSGTVLHPYNRERLVVEFHCAAAATGPLRLNVAPWEIEAAFARHHAPWSRRRSPERSPRARARSRSRRRRRSRTPRRRPRSRTRPDPAPWPLRWLLPCGRRRR